MLRELEIGFTGRMQPFDRLGGAKLRDCAQHISAQGVEAFRGQFHEQGFLTVEMAIGGIHADANAPGQITQAERRLGPFC